MAAYRRVYDSPHLQADCQAGISSGTLRWAVSMGYLYLFTLAPHGEYDVSICAAMEIWPVATITVATYYSYPGLFREPLVQTSPNFGAYGLCYPYPLLG